MVHIDIYYKYYYYTFAGNYVVIFFAIYIYFL